MEATDWNRGNVACAEQQGPSRPDGWKALPTRVRASLQAHGRRPLDRRVGLPFLLLLCLGLLGTTRFVSAQPRSPVAGAVQSRSHSGQFVVQALPAAEPRSRLVSDLETNRNYVRLDPTVVPVSCERTKQILYRLLGADTAWKGRVFLALSAARSGDDPITLTTAHFRDGWQYRLDMPDLVDRSRYVRCLVEVLLLEMANRGAGDRCAEIPVWLSEGFSRELLLSSEIEIILPLPRPVAGGLSLATALVNARKQNPLEQAHQRLCANPPLTFQQLSWPTADQLVGEPGEVYRSSAQLFVNELLRLKDGAACLRAMLAELPRYYNWQFAFLRAFSASFQRPLDIEKWWALQLEHFTGRDLTQTWPASESWGKFNAVVRSSVQIRSQTNDLPLEAEVNLQTIIREWDHPRQTPVLQAKVRLLEQLRLRLAPQLTPLADEYHRVLVRYLEHRDRALLPFRKKAAQRRAAAEAIQELDRLDALLADLRPFDMFPRTAPADAARANR